MTREERTEHAALKDSEPEIYSWLICRSAGKVHLGGKDRDFAFCVNSPGAGGYMDEDVIWVADQITDPVLAMEFAIHEMLHAAFPKLAESTVERTAQEMARVLAAMFKAKGIGVLPLLKPMLTQALAKQMFPEGIPDTVLDNRPDLGSRD